jgi:hypothetical protein
MCPLCGSRFIVTASRVEAGKGWQTWNARCGQCHTWRTDVLSDRAARRFGRHLKREAKRMNGLVRGTPWADPDRELRWLAATQPGPRR